MIFFLLLSVLILVHEFGHFFAARKLGVVAEEFGLGLPPRLRHLFSWKGTEFSLNWLPIGGFVRMRGEDREDPKGLTFAKQRLDLKGYFYAQKPWKRAIILIAGVTMNLIFAVTAFTVVYSFLGIPTETNKVIIQGIAPGSPAAAGFKENDTVIGFSATQEFIEFVNQNRGKEVSFSLERPGLPPEGRLIQVKVIPRLADQTPEGEGALGVAIGNIKYVHHPWWKMPFLAAATGIKEALGWSLNIISGLGGMFKQLITTGQLPKDIAGPVGIAYIAGNVARQGWLALTQFAGILSVNLAIVNLLPFPALDGGRLMFLGIEKIRGRPVSPKKERWAHLIGYAVLIFLILLATIQDILRIFS